MPAGFASANNPPLAPTLAPLLDGDTPPRAAFDRLRLMEFRSVQLSATHPGLRPRELDKSARRDLLATLRRNDLDPSGIDLWIPSADFDDAKKADRALSAVLNAIELAVDMRAGSGGQPLTISLLLPTNPNAAQSIVDHAQHYGVRLADHSIPALQRDGVGVGIDPVAWLLEGTKPDEAVTAASSRLLSARLSDVLPTGMRGPLSDRAPGVGKLDALAYKVALSVSGYRRAVVADARQWLDPWRGIESTRDVWSRL
ncbi:MAG: hypothetical protein L0Y42_05645 [Phycisphaerales bacterium]|nr:hypothetical protein [Phycisphaerales bacterium]